MYAAFLAQANGYLVALAPPVGLNLTASVSGRSSHPSTHHRNPDDS